MKTKTHMLMFLALVAAMITFACGGSAVATSVPETSVPEQTTDIVQEPTRDVVESSGELEIVSTNSYTDSFGDYNVSGELKNNTSKTIENITLSISITDESGASLLTDSDGNTVDSIEIWPHLAVLVPGAVTPFNYYISAEDVKPAEYEVTIKDFDSSSAPDLADVSIENVQSLEDEDGDMIITGEVINNTSDHVDVEALAGAILNDAGAVLAANSTLTYSHYLFPVGDELGRDRSPFIVNMYGPLPDAAQWKVYVRAVENSSPSFADVDVQLTNSYVDSYGDYHLLGMLTNNGDSQISPSVVGGLYYQDKTVADATSLNIPLYVNPGESVPFDLSTFQVIDSLEEASGIEKVAQPDLYWTFTTDYEVETLEAKDVKVTQDGSYWTITGTVVNTSDRKLSSISAVVMFLDDNHQVMATNSTSVYAPEGSDTIDPGTSNDFSISMYGADNWDLSSKEYQIILQGVVAE